MANKRTDEELIGILDRTIAWIENCDSKTSIFLGVLGALGGILLATDYVKKFLEIYRYMINHINFWAAIYLIFYIISIGFIVAGIVSWIRVLFARVDIKEFSSRGCKTDSLIFFSSIASYGLFSMYKEKIENCESEEMTEDLISQIYIYAQLFVIKSLNIINLG